MKSRFHSLYRRPENKPFAGAAPFPGNYRDALNVDLNADTWQLTLTLSEGVVRTLTLADLLALPQSRLEGRLVSADGWTYKGQWDGVRLGDLLRGVGMPEPGGYLVQTNASGHRESLEMGANWQSRPWLVCHGLNGSPLDVLHGGPVRLLALDRYAYKGLGQLSALEICASDLDKNFWEAHGYERAGTIQPGDYYAFDLGAFRTVRGPETI